MITDAMVFLQDKRIFVVGPFSIDKSMLSINILSKLNQKRIKIDSKSFVHSS